MKQQDKERAKRIAWLRAAIQQGLASPVEEWEGADEIIRMAQEREKQALNQQPQQFDADR